MFLFLSLFSRQPQAKFRCALCVPWLAHIRAILQHWVLRIFWNPVMELFFHVRIGGIFVLIVNEIDLARLALSCHFALDVLCDKEGAHGSA